MTIRDLPPVKVVAANFTYERLVPLRHLQTHVNPGGHRGVVLIESVVDPAQNEEFLKEIWRGNINAEHRAGAMAD